MHTIWASTDPTASASGTPVDFVVNFPTTSYQVASVRIFVDPTQNGGSIDAVRLLTGGSPSSVTVSGRGADGSGHYLDTAYNSAGQPTTAETYTNGVLVQTVTSEYTSGVLSATNTTDADGRTTRVTLDSSGNTLTSTVAYGTGDAATTTNVYTDGNLTSVTDALSDETVYTYDSIGREDSMTDPLGNEETRGYDSDSRLAWVIDRNDQLTTYTYDDNGNPLTQTMYAGSTDTTTVVDTLTWTYNPDGTVATAGNNQGTYTYAYDDSARVIHVDEPSGVSLTFAYDDAGNRILVEDSLGGIEQSSYNANNQLISRTLTQGSDVLRIDFTYTQQGQIATETRYSDAAGTDLVATTVYTYDAAGNVASIVSKDASNSTIANYAYTTDAAGDLTSQTENGTTSDFTYDDQGELTGDGTDTYAFDAEGNSTADTFNATYKNQLASDGTWNYSYDANGNETMKVNIATGVTWTYGYDNRNEMTEAKEWTEDPVYYGTAYVELQENFKYDVYANRIEQDYYSSGPITSSAVVTKFAVDGWDPAKGTPVGNENFDVWADLTGSGTLQTRYLRGDAVDQLLARIDQSGATLSPYWELTDQLGSVRDVIDNSTGAVKDAISYDSFGNIDTGSETDATYRGRYAWTGREFDVETDLQYNRARYYDASTGRWISQDPIEFDAGDSNLYRYVNNKPATAMDSSGLQQAEVKELRKEFDANLDKKAFPNLKPQDYFVIAKPNGSNCYTYAIGQKKIFDDPALTKYFGVLMQVTLLQLFGEVNSAKGNTAIEKAQSFTTNKVLSPLTALYKPAGYSLASVFPNIGKLEDYDRSKKQLIAVYGNVVSIPIVLEGKKEAIKTDTAITAMHAALKPVNGKWVSQFGSNGFVVQTATLHDLEGPEYGRVIAIYEKK